MTEGFYKMTFAIVSMKEKKNNHLILLTRTMENVRNNHTILAITQS